MADVHQSLATLNVSGESLDFSEVTRLLGAEPSDLQTKGDQSVSPTTGRGRIAKTSLWSLSASEREPENLDSQVQEILHQLTDDLEVWKDLAHRFEIELFCGLFMEVSNEGLSLSPSTLAALGKRGIELVLDIYAP